MTLCTDKRGYDKSLHYVMGIVIALIVGICFALIPPHIPWLTVVVTLSAVVFVAVGWEFYRMRKLPGNHICVWDILWTILGGVSICWLPWLTAYLLAVNG